MSKRRLVDTNLIIRHLTQDHEAHALAAGKLFEACDRGEIVLVIMPPVLAEVVFVLESFYDQPRHDISSVLSRLLSSPGIDLVDNEIYQDALVEYGRSKLHFVDCVIVAHARAHNVPVATFDQGYRKMSGIKIQLQ